MPQTAVAKLQSHCLAGAWAWSLGLELGLGAWAWSLGLEHTLTPFSILSSLFVRMTSSMPAAH